MSDPKTINDATADELVEIAGLGPQQADKVVLHRDTHGPFRTISDLESVSGMDVRTVRHVLGHFPLGADEGPTNGRED